ncbi:MAG: UDP-N-acetylmuramoyl-tripeptide--D-alanyl-D-alanine ligase [Armatimonadetes bacterium]|nr:UDP-N-acetylmuramoyl-tripeptide--D-alanyl-D-alanine ligase [Armatimonadota bacterium]
MNHTLGEFAHRLGGKLVSANREGTFHGFSLDSRDVKPGSVFLAIKGERVDGLDFASTALKLGAAAYLGTREVGGAGIIVDDIAKSLARFAKSVREEYSGPVIGITGSNGKTSTKEFVSAACHPLGSIVKNPGNWNTEFTAPLIWDGVDSDTAAVVAELAMRGFDQIDHLAAFTQPTVGIITLIGTAHIEMVQSREGIAQAKGEIIPHIRPDGMLILWQEDEFLEYLKAKSRVPVQTFGFSGDATCQITGYRALDWRRSEVQGVLHGKSFRLELNTVGKHQALNAAAALLAAGHLGVPVPDAIQNLPTAQLPPMRMEVIEWRGVTIVLDNYNASPDSTVAALNTLAEVASKGRRVAVLGEMKELGELSEIGHRQVGKALLRTHPDQVVLFGEQSALIHDEALGLGFPATQMASAPSIEDITSVLLALQPGDTVLIKGSRALGLEKAVEALPR